MAVGRLCTTTTVPRRRYAVEREAELPTTKWEEEIARGLELGLPGADSIVDKRIPTFSRGELPHFAGINTFLKAPYLEDVRRCGEYDVAVLGAPVRRRHHLPLRDPVRAAGHPQDLRALRPVQLRAGRRPARVHHHRRPRRHLHDPGQHREDLRPDLQGRRARLRLGRVPGRARRRPLDRLPDRARGGPAPDGGNLGIIHFDRHVDTQETDLDERMHTTPWFHATDIPNVPAEEPRPDRHRRVAGAAARA